MTRADQEAAVLLDRALDEAGSGGPEDGDELAALMAVASLLRRNPEWEVATIDGARARPRLTGRAKVAAVLVLLLGLTAGALAETGKRSPVRASSRQAACLQGAAVVGEDSGLPAAAKSYIVNQLRQFGDPCPTRAVRWARVSTGFGPTGTSGYGFEALGSFAQNPLERGGVHRQLFLFWSPSGSTREGFSPVVRLGRSRVHRLLVRPARRTPLPEALVSRLREAGAVSPVSYVQLPLGATRTLSGLDLWSALAENSPTYGLKALLRDGSTIRWLAVRTPTGFRIKRGFPEVALRRLLRRGTSAYWFRPHIPSELPREVMRQAGLNMTPARTSILRWVAVSAGHIRSVDPYEEVVPEQLPRDALVFLAQEGKHGTLLVAIELGHSFRFAGFAGSPLDGRSMSDLGEVHRRVLRTGASPR